MAMRLRSLRPPGGPRAEPTTNWDDAPDRSHLPSVAAVSIPPDDGVADRRGQSIPPILNGRRAARRCFWGVTRRCHRRVCRGEGGRGLTPLTCLAPPRANAPIRTSPAPEEFAKVQRIVKLPQKREKASAQKERTIDFRGH